MNFGAFGPTCTIELLMLGVERRLEKGVGDLRGVSNRDASFTLSDADRHAC